MNAHEARHRDIRAGIARLADELRKSDERAARLRKTLERTKAELDAIYAACRVNPDLADHIFDVFGMAPWIVEPESEIRELWDLPACMSPSLCKAIQCCQEDCAVDGSVVCPRCGGNHRAVNCEDLNPR